MSNDLSKVRSITQFKALTFVTPQQLSDVLNSFSGEVVDVVVHKTSFVCGNIFEINGEFYALAPKVVYQTTDPAEAIPPHSVVNKEVVGQAERTVSSPAALAAPYGTEQIYPYKSYDDQSKYDKLVALCDNPEVLKAYANSNLGFHFKVVDSRPGWESYKLTMGVARRLPFGQPIPNLKSLLSEETRNKLRRNGDYVGFDLGWIFNVKGELGIVLNLPGAGEIKA